MKFAIFYALMAIMVSINLNAPHPTTVEPYSFVDRVVMSMSWPLVIPIAFYGVLSEEEDESKH